MRFVFLIGNIHQTTTENSPEVSTLVIQLTSSPHTSKHPPVQSRFPRPPPPGHLTTIDYFLCSPWGRQHRKKPIWRAREEKCSFSALLLGTYKLHITNFSINIAKEHISQDEISMIQDIKSTCCGLEHSPPPRRAFFNHCVDPIDVLGFIELRPSTLRQETLEYPQIVSEERLLNRVGHVVDWVVVASVIGSLVEERWNYGFHRRRKWFPHIFQPIKRRSVKHRKALENHFRCRIVLGRLECGETTRAQIFQHNHSGLSGLIN